MKEKLIAQIQNFHPSCPQEERDRDLILQLLAGCDDLTRRENLAHHLTASAWVVSPDRSSVLMAYHNLYNSWAWLGGHADGEWNLLQVAKREAAEESGIRDLRTVTEDIFSLEILTVNGHEKKGSYIPSHLHLNLTYLFEADPTAQLRINPDENSDVGWVRTADVPIKSSEPWFVERIYSKLIEKSLQYK